MTGRQASYYRGVCKWFRAIFAWGDNCSRRLMNNNRFEMDLFDYFLETLSMAIFQHGPAHRLGLLLMRKIRRPDSPKQNEEGDQVGY
jgi:hypothetical protein